MDRHVASMAVQRDDSSDEDYEAADPDLALAMGFSGFGGGK